MSLSAGENNTVSTWSGQQADPSQWQPANAPANPDDPLQQIEQQRALVERARAEADRTGDPVLRDMADRLERDYHSQQMAELAGRVYDQPTGRDPVTGGLQYEAIPGWTRASSLSPEQLRDQYGLSEAQLRPTDSDFRAEVFIPDPAVFGPDAQPVLAFRGSVTAADWKNNFLQGAGQESDHYNRAMDVARAVNSKTDGDFEITGHSLGGGLATAASAVTGAEATTFNSAGLHDATAQRYVEAQGGRVFEVDSRINAYQVEGDILTELQSSSGELHPVVAERVANLLKTAIGLGDNRIVEQLGLDRHVAGLEPLGNATGEDLRNAPQASGTHIQLDAMQPDGNGYAPRPDALPLGGPDGIIARSETAAQIATSLTETIRVLSTPGRLASDAGNAIDRGLDNAGSAFNRGITGVGERIDGALDTAGQSADRALDRAGERANDGISGAGRNVNEALDGVRDVPVLGWLADKGGNLVEGAANGLGNATEFVVGGTGDLIRGGTDLLGNVTGFVTNHTGNAVQWSADQLGSGAGWAGDALELANLAGATTTVAGGAAAGTIVVGAGAIRVFGPGPVTAEALRQYHQFREIAGSIGEMGTRHGMDTVEASLNANIARQERELLRRIGQ